MATDNHADLASLQAAQGFDGRLRGRRDAVVDPAQAIAHAKCLQAMRQGLERHQACSRGNRIFANGLERGECGAGIQGVV